MNHEMLERYKKFYYMFVNQDLQAQINANDKNLNSVQQVMTPSAAVPKNFDMDKIKNS
jgi:hypothetical protein